MKAKNRIPNILVCLIMIAAAFAIAVPMEGGVDAPTGIEKPDSGGSILNLATIDPEPPEAAIHFDTYTMEIVVYGIDDIDEDVEVVETIVEEKKHQKTSLYTLADDAGNTLDLLLGHKSSDGNTEVRVLEMSYNNGESLIPGENHFKIEFKIEKETRELAHLHQNIHVIDEFKIDTNYRPEETSINYRGKEFCKAKFEAEGLALIGLETDDGELIVSHYTDDLSDYYTTDDLLDFHDYFEKCEGGDVVRVDPTQLVSYVSLENTSSIPMEIRFGDVFGVPEFLAGRWATDPTITDPEDKAINFIMTYGDLFRLNPTTDSFTVSSVNTRRLYITNVRLQQMYLGIPVYGAEELVHLDQNNNILFMHGTFVPEINIGTTPAISVNEAFDIAYEDLKDRFPNVQNVSIMQYELFVLNLAVINEMAVDANVLVWSIVVETFNPYGLWLYFVDAESGEIVESWDAIPRWHPSEVYEVVDGFGRADDDILWFEDGVKVHGGTPHRDISNLNDFGSNYYNYLLDEFGWNSIDGRGQTLVGRVDLSVDPDSPGWLFLYEEARFYQWWVTQDVVAHEYTHGLVQKSGGTLGLSGQPGALNEHLSDSFGEFLDCRTECNWLVGLDAFGSRAPDGPWRSMESPSRYGDPDHMDDYAPGLDVHYSAGIPNRVVHLLAEGGIHYGISVRELGLEKTEQLVFSTLVDTGLTTRATFRMYSDVMLQTCKAMIGGPAGITSSDCREVSDAWCSVGICYLTQNVVGFGNENFDKFGYSLATGDFDNDNFEDLAVGIPFKNYGRTDSGIVLVFYGSYIGLSARGAEVISQYSKAGEQESDDRFGHSLASGDFNGDEYDDLAVGIPFENFTIANRGMAGHIIRHKENVGQVVVFYGSSDGLYAVLGRTKTEWLNQEEHTTRTNDDRDMFGYSLAAGDFDGDDYDDLAIGVPNKDLNGRSNTGIVVVFYGSWQGLVKEAVVIGMRPTKFEILDQEDAGERNERHDKFGRSLAAGNFNGDDYDDLAVGVPYENIDGVGNAGMVLVFYGDEDGLIVSGSATTEQLNQEMIGETSETGDKFGKSLAVGDFDGDTFDDLAIGTPSEDIEKLGLGADIVNAGMVTIIYGESDGLVRDGIVVFPATNHETLGDDVYTFHRGDSFGYSLASGDFTTDHPQYDDLAIGIPYADIFWPDIPNTGVAAVFYGSSEGLIDDDDGSASFQNLYQEEMGGVSERGDRLGFALAFGDFDRSEGDELVVSAPLENLLFGIRDAGAVYLWES